MENSTSVDLYRIFTRSIMPVIICLGLLGNMLAVVIISRTFRRRFPSHTFLAALALVDIAFLLVLLVQWTGSLAGYRVTDTTQLGCKLSLYVTHTTDMASEWLIVCISFERFVVLFYPNKRKQVCTVKNARILTFFVLLVCFTYNIWTLIISELIFHRKINRYTCEVREEQLVVYTWLNGTDSVLACFLPSVLVAYLNLKMVYNLHKYYKPCTTVVRGLTQVMECANAPNSIFVPLRRQQIVRQSDNQLTRSLIAITTVYIMLKIPSYVVRIIQTSGIHVHDVIMVASLMLYYVHHAISFYLYTFLGPGMRAVFWKSIKRVFISIFTCEFLVLCCSCGEHWEDY